MKWLIGGLPGLWGYVLFAGLSFSLAFSGSTYPYYGPLRGWPVGEWAEKNGWFVYHGFAALTALFTCWKLGGLVGLLAGLMGGFIIAFGLVNLLKSWSQVASLLSLPSAIAALWLMSRFEAAA